jgi:hypothetical protein
MNVQLPDGTTIDNVPDGTTKAQIAEKLQANGRTVPQEWLAPKEPSYGDKVKQTGEAFNKAAGTGLSSVGRTAVAAVEDVGSMASGVIGDIAGAVTSVATQDPKRGEAVKESLTYQPRTEAGKKGAEYLGALAEPVTKVAGAIPKYLEEHGHPIAGQAARAAIDVAPIKGVGKAGDLAKEIGPAAGRIAKAGEESAAVRSAEEAPKQAKIEQARSIGLKLPPSEAGGAVGKALEGAGGKVQTEMTLSRANAKVINRTAAQEIGLSDRQPLTEANIDRAKEQQFAVYDRVKKAGRIASDDEFKQELTQVKERTAQAEEDYPEDTNELIDKEIKKFDRTSADSSSMLEKIKSLRNKASRNMQAPDAEKFELGIAQKKIATAMENLIERQVSDKGLIKDFRAARQQLAKIYNVEDALSPNGNISAAVLARQLKRGVPLSGGLKTLAQTYQEFPKVMRYVDSLGGHAPFSALDYLVGGVASVAHPGAIPKVVGALAARPLARGIIKSETYQKRGIKPREVKPSATARTARRVAGHTLQDLPKSTQATVGDTQ